MTRAERQLVEQAGAEFPERFARVRKACAWGAVNLDLHAARITLDVEELKRRARHPARPALSPKGA